MENQSSSFFDQELDWEEHSLDSMIQEIWDFNKYYGFIKTVSKSVSHRVNSILRDNMDKESFDQERDFRFERILRFNDLLIDMWLEVYDYRGEEFYEDNKISATWHKIWLLIVDEEIFLEFVNEITPDENNRLFTFLYEVIVDSLKKSDFYWWSKVNSQKIQQITEFLDIANKCEKIFSGKMNWLLEDYKNYSLYQSLLSKMTIVQLYNNAYIDSLKKFDNYEYLENVIIDWFWALDTIQKSKSTSQYHKKYEYLLAEVLHDILHHVYTVAYEEVVHDKKLHYKNPEHPVFQSVLHQSFIINFLREYQNRKKMLSQVLSNNQ